MPSMRISLCPVTVNPCELCIETLERVRELLPLDVVEKSLETIAKEVCAITGPYKAKVSAVLIFLP